MLLPQKKKEKHVGVGFISSKQAFVFFAEFLNSFPAKQRVQVISRILEKNIPAKTENGNSSSLLDLTKTKAEAHHRKMGLPDNIKAGFYQYTNSTRKTNTLYSTEKCNVFIDMPNLEGTAKTIDELLTLVFESFISCFKFNYDSGTRAQENQILGTNSVSTYLRAVEDVYDFHCGRYSNNSSDQDIESTTRAWSEVRNSRKRSRNPRDLFENQRTEATIQENQRTEATIQEKADFFSKNFQGTVYCAFDGPNSLSKLYCSLHRIFHRSSGIFKEYFDEDPANSRNLNPKFRDDMIVELLEQEIGLIKKDPQISEDLRKIKLGDWNEELNKLKPIENSSSFHHQDRFDYKKKGKPWEKSIFVPPSRFFLMKNTSSFESEMISESDNFLNAFFAENSSNLPNIDKAASNLSYPMDFFDYMETEVAKLFKDSLFRRNSSFGHFILEIIMKSRLRMLSKVFPNVNFVYSGAQENGEAEDKFNKFISEGNSLNQKHDSFFFVSKDTDFYTYGFLMPKIQNLYFLSAPPFRFNDLRLLSETLLREWIRDFQREFPSITETDDEIKDFLTLQFLFVGRFLSKTDYYENFMPFLTPFSGDSFFHPLRFPVIEPENSNYKINLLNLLKSTELFNSNMENYAFPDSIPPNEIQNFVSQFQKQKKKDLEKYHLVDETYMNIWLSLSKEKPQQKSIEAKFEIQFKQETCHDFFWFLATAIVCLSEEMSINSNNFHSFDPMRQSSMKKDEKQIFVTQTILFFLELLEIRGNILENAKKTKKQIKFDIVVEDFKLKQKHDSKFTISFERDQDFIVRFIHEPQNAQLPPLMNLGFKGFCGFPSFSKASIPKSQFDLISKHFFDGDNDNPESEVEVYTSTLFLKHVKKILNPFVYQQFVGENERKFLENVKKFYDQFSPSFLETAISQNDKNFKQLARKASEIESSSLSLSPPQKMRKLESGVEQKQISKKQTVQKLDIQLPIGLIMKKVLDKAEDENQMEQLKQIMRLSNEKFEKDFPNYLNSSEAENLNKLELGWILYSTFSKPAGNLTKYINGI